MTKTGKRMMFEDWVDEEDARHPGFRAEIEAEALARIQGLDLWEQLVATRRRKGVTQREVARRMGTERRYVAQVERKVRNREFEDITAGALLRYAAALGARVSVEPA